MQGQTTDKTVLRIRLRWVPSVVAGAGLVLTVFGLTPAQATSPVDTGTHQSYVCRYVGNPLRLADGENPTLVDIASVTGTGFVDDLRNGHIYVLLPNSGRLDVPPGITDCPGYTPPTTTTTSTTTGPTVTASGSSTTSSTTSTTTDPTVTVSASSTTSSPASSTTSTTTDPSVTASASSTTSSTTSTTTDPSVTASASSTTSPTTQPSVSSTSAPATSPTITATPVLHSTGAPKPPAGTSHQNASDPAANTVPLAATDGADLAGQPVQPSRDGILAAGFLLMMAGGVLSTRRTHGK